MQEHHQSHLSKYFAKVQKTVGVAVTFSTSSLVQKQEWKTTEFCIWCYTCNMHFSVVIPSLSALAIHIQSHFCCKTKEPQLTFTIFFHLYLPTNPPKRSQLNTTNGYHSFIFWTTYWPSIVNVNFEPPLGTGTLTGMESRFWVWRGPINRLQAFGPIFTKNRGGP